MLVVATEKIFWQLQNMAYGNQQDGSCFLKKLLATKKIVSVAQVQGLLLDGVLESAVIGLPHPDFGEAVAAVVVPADSEPPGEEEMIAQLKAGLAGFKVPKRVFLADALPRNAMGKVQKNQLREQFRDSFS